MTAEWKKATAAMEGPEANTLWVGTEGGEVVINHPNIDPDENGVGHIIFSPEQAESLAKLLLRHAQEARQEQILLLVDALKEIEWSNDSRWQSDRARAALAATAPKDSKG